MAPSLPPHSVTSLNPNGVKEPAYLAQTRAWNPTSLPDLKSATLKTALPRMMSHPNIAAKRHFSIQKKPPGPTVKCGGDAGVIEARLDTSDRLIALTTGGNGRFCYLNPRRGAQIAVVECLRRLACTGAVPYAFSSSLTMVDPVKPEEAFLLSECHGGLTEVGEFFGLPELGRSVSLQSAGKAAAGDPVLTVSVLGQIEHEKHFTRQTVRAAGEKLILLGAAATELGGSQYQGIIHQLKAGEAPHCDFSTANKLNHALHALIKTGQIHGAHEISEGGLLCCVAEMLFAPDHTFGVTLELATLQGTRLDALLFGESQNRAVVVVAAERVATVLADAHLRGVSAALIGEVSAGPDFTVRGATDEAVTWSVADLREGWANSLLNKINNPGQSA